jgi:hypothetical protein
MMKHKPLYTKKCSWSNPPPNSHVYGHYSPPLCYIHRFNDPWYLIHKSDGSSDMVQHFHISNLFPRHRHILQKFHNCMRHIFQCAEIKCNECTQELNVNKNKYKKLCQEFSTLSNQLKRACTKVILKVRTICVVCPRRSVTGGSEG